MWSGPVADFLDFIRVGEDAIGRDNVPQEVFDLEFRELKLFGVSVAEALEYRRQVVQVIRVISAKHNNVILVDNVS